MRYQPADKSRINRRPCFLPSTLGADTIKHHLQMQDEARCLRVDITDIRALVIAQAPCQNLSVWHDLAIQTGANERQVSTQYASLATLASMSSVDGSRVSSTI